MRCNLMYNANSRDETKENKLHAKSSFHKNVRKKCKKFFTQYTHINEKADINFSNFDKNEKIPNLSLYQQKTNQLVTNYSTMLATTDASNTRGKITAKVVEKLPNKTESAFSSKSYKISSIWTYNHRRQISGKSRRLNHWPTWDWNRWKNKEIKRTFADNHFSMWQRRVLIWLTVLSDSIWWIQPWMTLNSALNTLNDNKFNTKSI